MNIHKNSAAADFLKNLAVGAGFLIVALTAPKLAGKMAKALLRYERNKQFERSRLLRDMHRLQKRELVELKYISKDEIRIKLTKAGKEKALQYRIEEMFLNIPKRWDRKWRLVIFDIPEDDRKARNALRGKLRQLGFYPLQRSVFITPYPCEDEIDFIAMFFNVRQHILLLELGRFEGEENLKSYFDLG